MISSGSQAENVLVICRCRPFSEKEKAAGHANVSIINPKDGTIQMVNPKNESDAKKFTFDAVFDETCTQV